ncbi:MULTISPECIES: hypothetical protein [Halobacterium]|uniref:Uncharacterized protein n=3 Tax=Halobacterium salinarum TaxID=2242 RepID=Q9HQG2_HALSA|nr:hypothetical protein [Halobacterium salinarum]AAG19553.1 hypothetical protein VNG_1178H [Halobacterium salinarum NRC-1]MBB6090240.1 hypothetical protein [Halobacterium salinarum]MDL0119038.1 hypothetical protein [Halobacterium salinarum]MDL0125709.1 hypothetical protein [Halobacterium salinarum]MDL0129802.1 hypothetical protein [Halobacterium salinarum]
MQRHRFVTLSLLAFGLVLVGFVTLGFSRIVLPYHVARLLAAPAILGAAALICWLAVQAALIVAGVRTLEPDSEPRD